MGGHRIDGGDLVARNRGADKYGLACVGAAGTCGCGLTRWIEELAAVVVIGSWTARSAQVGGSSCQQAAEVSRSLGCSGHQGGCRCPLHQAQAFIIAKEEELFRPPDRAAKRCAVLVPAKLWL